MASKNFTVILSKAAERELTSIFRYVALNKENPIAAKRFIHALEKRLLSLKNQPESYAVYEPCPDFHIIHFGRYKIIYKVHAKKRLVVVAHIFHSLQNPSNVL